MTPDEAMRAVGSDAVARDTQGGVHGEGRVISYSIVPTLTIERADGTRFSWRHDMCEAVES